jgi:predicted nucleic acid-binding protein
VARYLADSSIWGWANSAKRPDIQAKLADRFQAGEVVTCAPVVLEVMHRARTGGDYERTISEVFGPLSWLPLGSEVADRAVEVQRGLAGTSHGNHLRPAIDFLIAAIAEAAGTEIVLWCLDRDLEIICEHTGQPYEPEDSSAS